MLIRNKYYPYPVVAAGNDSYATTQFTSDVDFEKNGYNIKLILNASINNAEIEALISSKKASIVHHIECVKTCYRHAVVTDENETVFQIHQNKVNGAIQITTVIVANEDLKGYKNSDFSSDYKGFSFNIKRGCLLAIGGCVEFEINKQKDDLENTSSIFSIVPNLDPNETIVKVVVSSTQPKIAIKIPVKECNIYKNLSSNLDLQSIMHSMIIVPALAKVFEELKVDRSALYNYESSCRWYKALKKACKNLNIEIDEQSLENLDSYETAQLLMDSPTMKALVYLAGGPGNEN